MNNEPFPPSLFGRRLFKIHVGLLLWFCSLALCGFLVYFHQVFPQFRDSIKFGATLLAATVTIASILIASENLRRGVQERRAVAAARFLERWNDPKFSELKAKWRKLIKELEALTEEEVAKRLEESDSDRETTVDILNFFEELAISARTGAADEILLKRTFDSILFHYFSTVQPWVIRYRRKRNTPTMWSEVEMLVKAWQVPPDAA